MKEKLKSRLQRMYVTGTALLLLMLSMGSTVFACEYYYGASSDTAFFENHRSTICF